MTTVTTQQLAEILIGIARAQYAVVEAMDSVKPGFRATHFSPVLQTAARIREFNRQPTLADLPVRVLMDWQRRGGPDPAQIQRDLEALLGQAPNGPAVAASAAPVAAAKPAPSGDASLDFSAGT